MTLWIEICDEDHKVNIFSDFFIFFFKKENFNNNLELLEPVSKMLSYPIFELAFGNFLGCWTKSNESCLSYSYQWKKTWITQEYCVNRTFVHWMRLWQGQTSTTIIVYSSHVIRCRNVTVYLVKAYFLEDVRQGSSSWIVLWKLCGNSTLQKHFRNSIFTIPLYSGSIVDSLLSYLKWMEFMRGSPIFQKRSIKKNEMVTVF